MISHRLLEICSHAPHGLPGKVDSLDCPVDLLPGECIIRIATAGESLLRLIDTAQGAVKQRVQLMRQFNIDRAMFGRWAIGMCRYCQV